MKKNRILIVDSSDGFKKQMIWALKGDYEVFEAQNREEAFVYLEKEKKPSVVLLDLHLQPRIDFIDEGLRVLIAFKERLPGVKIIIITANSEKETISRAEQFGADDYILKPFKIESLKNSIKKVLSKTIPAGIERRKYWRLKCKLAVSYSVMKTNIGGKAETINISRGGLMLPVDQSIGAGEILDLEVSLSPELKVKTLGEIRWEKSINDAYYIGVQFIEITEEKRNRLVDYICRL